MGQTFPSQGQTQRITGSEHVAVQAIAYQCGLFFQGVRTPTLHLWRRIGRRLSQKDEDSVLSRHQIHVVPHVLHEAGAVPRTEPHLVDHKPHPVSFLYGLLKGVVGEQDRCASPGFHPVISSLSSVGMELLLYSYVVTLPQIEDAWRCGERHHLVLLPQVLSHILERHIILQLLTMGGRHGGRHGKDSC